MIIVEMLVYGLFGGLVQCYCDNTPACTVFHKKSPNCNLVVVGIGSPNSPTYQNYL